MFHPFNHSFKVKIRKIKSKINQNIIKIRIGASVNILHPYSPKCHKKNLKIYNRIKTLKKRSYCSRLWLCPSRSSYSSSGQPTPPASCDNPPDDVASLVGAGSQEIRLCAWHSQFSYCVWGS